MSIYDLCGQIQGYSCDKEFISTSHSVKRCCIIYYEIIVQSQLPGIKPGSTTFEANTQPLHRKGTRTNVSD